MLDIATPLFRPRLPAPLTLRASPLYAHYSLGQGKSTIAASRALLNTHCAIEIPVLTFFALRLYSAL